MSVHPVAQRIRSAILSVVVGDALDEAGQHFLG
jgi:hypothetical protein